MNERPEITRGVDESATGERHNVKPSLFDVRRDGREGMVTVVDYEGRIVGSMGVETWAKVLAEGDSDHDARTSANDG